MVYYAIQYVVIVMYLLLSVLFCLALIDIRPVRSSLSNLVHRSFRIAILLSFLFIHEDSHRRHTFPEELCRLCGHTYP